MVVNITKKHFSLGCVGSVGLCELTGFQIADSLTLWVPKISNTF